MPQVRAVCARLTNDRPRRIFAWERGSRKPRAGLPSGALRRVRAYIEEHLAERVRTDVLARVAMLSLGHFNRAFLQSTGFSPHQYILRQRVALASSCRRRAARSLTSR